jgi:2-polyprenyl-3-methyl-5-hydroxy-6-metoxy-1,4-benzoquinol methylase
MKPQSVFDNIYTRYSEGWGCSERSSQLFRYRLYLEMLSRLPRFPSVVLDVGCGEGYLSDRLQRQGAQVVAGIDLSEVAIQRARARYPRIAFHQSSITDIPWESLQLGRKLDLVVLGEVLYYLTESEQRDCVARIFERIEDGAHVLASVNIGPKPYFTAESLSELFSAFECLETRSIYLRTYHRYVEAPLWYVRNRYKRAALLSSACRTLLRAAPVAMISRLSGGLSLAEESIRIGLFRKPALRGSPERDRPYSAEMDRAGGGIARRIGGGDVDVMIVAGEPRTSERKMWERQKGEERVASQPR